FKESNRTAGQFIPTEHPDLSEVPASPDVKGALKDYRGSGLAVAQGEAFTPSPQNIEARVTRVTLPNGMKLVMLPKRTRGAAVRLNVALRMGTEQTLWGKAAVSQLTAQMLMRGTTRLSRPQLDDELTRL